MNVSSALLCLALAHACLGCAQVPRPPAGVDVDEVRRIRLLSDIPQPCLAIDMPKTTIVLAKSHLEHLAAASGTTWKTEDERMAFITARRAQAILDLVSGSIDSAGCARLAASIPSESLYLLTSLLEAGQAAVISTRSHALLPEIGIRYVGMRCGPRCGRGEIMFLLSDSDEILFVMPWWAS